MIFCGPSGAGKSTLIDKLKADFPDDFGFSVSDTTRNPRPGEVDGVHYNFRKLEDMRAAVERGEFLESAQVHGNLYGTSIAAVNRVRQSNKICILDIDVQGVRSCVRADIPTALKCFIAPPSVEDLERRLRARGTETEETLRTRVNNASKEMAAAATLPFDVTVINDSVERAYKELKEIMEPIVAARRRRKNKTG